MSFEDKEKLQKEYNIIMNKHENMDNILSVYERKIRKRSIPPGNCTVLGFSKTNNFLRSGFQRTSIIMQIKFK